MVFSALLSAVPRVLPKLISGFGAAVQRGAEAYQQGSGILGALKAGAKRFGVSVLDTAADELPALGGLLNPVRERLVDTAGDMPKKAPAPVLDTSMTTTSAPAGLLPALATPKPSKVDSMATNPGKRNKAHGGL